MDKKRREMLSLVLPSALVALSSSTKVFAADDGQTKNNTLAPLLTTNTEDSISFKKFLVEKKGTVNATQALIDAVTSGIPVEIPHDYVLRIESAGIPTVSGARLFGQAGTMPKVIIDHSDLDKPQFILGGRNKIENLIFRYPNQKLYLKKGEAPVKYKPLFCGGGYYSEFRNLDIGNAYYGFLIGTKEISSSHVVIENVIGSPIFRGLSLDCCLDIPRISDVHFNYNYLIDDGFKYDQSLKQWIYDHATAFHIGRCDFATFFRLFSYGYHRGIYLRSERSLGSADNCRFISCDVDMSRHPIWFQNWQNKVSVLDSKLVGNAEGKKMGFLSGLPSYNVIRNTDNGQAILDNLDINDYTSHALTTQSNTIVSNCRFSRYGSGNKLSAGIFVNEQVPLHIDNTSLNGSSGIKTVGVYSDISKHALNLGSSVQFSGQTDASFYWSNGAVLLDNSVDLGGARGVSDISTVTHIPKNYYSEDMPSAGNYFLPGDNVILTKLSNAVEDAVGRYILTGFKRLTASNARGDNHEENVDWVGVKLYL
ncbi:hypothetical protein [Serratia ureilytica]|uniref:hypothetical protein n=1 Tax=Serratia ureilytica TaxID=300181 RepID=UPI00214E0C17|nr:hypothetical protein [Serratia ureilytica]UUW19802.1 hypothetical protein NAL25_07860 [Serratia ureilytica]